MTAIVIVQGVAILLLGALVIGLLRSHAEILRSLHELGAEADVGDPAPRNRVPVDIGARPGHDVRGVLPDGTAALIGVADSPHNTLLAFLSTTCLTCAPFWEAATGGADLLPDTRLVVVVQEEDNERRLARLTRDSPDLLVIRSTKAWEEYEVPGSPHFVLVEHTSGRIIGEGTGHTWQQVHDLLAQSGQGIVLPHAEDRDDPVRIDEDLAAAGITAGHPSLHRVRLPAEDG